MTSDLCKISWPFAASNTIPAIDPVTDINLKFLPSYNFFSSSTGSADIMPHDHIETRLSTPNPSSLCSLAVPRAGYSRTSFLGCHYSIVEAPRLPPPLPTDSHIRLVYDAGDASAVWSFSDAFLKVKMAQDRTAATRDPATLRLLAKLKLSFAITDMLHYTEEADRSYLCLARARPDAC